MFSKCFDRCFGGVVSWISRRVGNALFGAGDDDAGWICGGSHKWEKGVDAVNYAKEVDREDGLEVGSVAPGSFGTYARVETEKGDLAWS